MYLNVYRCEHDTFVHTHVCCLFRYMYMSPSHISLLCKQEGSIIYEFWHIFQLALNFHDTFGSLRTNSQMIFLWLALLRLPCAWMSVECDATMLTPPQSVIFHHYRHHRPHITFHIEKENIIKVNSFLFHENVPLK